MQTLSEREGYGVNTDTPLLLRERWGFVVLGMVKHRQGIDRRLSRCCDLLNISQMDAKLRWGKRFRFECSGWVFSTFLA